MRTSRRGRGRRRATRECRGKTKYPTRQAAITAATALFRTTGAGLRPYRCKHCRLQPNRHGEPGPRAWHLGHHAPQQRRLRG